MGIDQQLIQVGINGPWAKLRRGHAEDTYKRPAVFYT